jgi:3-deoxy-7-phosphoheptulonate synthase
VNAAFATFETYTRNTLDLSAIPIIKQESHCPVVIDSNQGAGRADLVIARCKGSVAAGADALLIEVHPNPAEALSDGAQQLSLAVFAKGMQELRPLILVAGRE